MEYIMATHNVLGNALSVIFVYLSNILLRRRKINDIRIFPNKKLRKLLVRYQSKPSNHKLNFLFPFDVRKIKDVEL